MAIWSFELPSFARRRPVGNGLCSALPPQNHGTNRSRIKPRTNEEQDASSSSRPGAAWRLSGRGPRGILGCQEEGRVMMHAGGRRAALTGLAGACCALASAGSALALECSVGRQVKCGPDQCTAEKTPDENGLRFVVDERKKTVSAQEGEGARSGRASIVKSAGALALSARLGPVMQGGKALGRDSQALTLQADLKTKAFTAVREGDILLGTCD
ncbi:MAG: hypothetical protein ACJ8CC_00635 [Microvirga sp.]